MATSKKVIEGASVRESIDTAPNSQSVPTSRPPQAWARKDILRFMPPSPHGVPRRRGR